MKERAPFQPHDGHWVMTHFRETVTKDQLRDVLLNFHAPMRGGRLCQWRHKHLGVGVYELWMDVSEDDK